MERSPASRLGIVAVDAAEAYEEAFVPAFFSQWAPVLCDAAGVTAGQSVLDVACGTGIVARTAADLVGPPNVVGVDINEAMLTVARRVPPDLDWRQGDAGALPHDERPVDGVILVARLDLEAEAARRALVFHFPLDLEDAVAFAEALKPARDRAERDGRRRSWRFDGGASGPRPHSKASCVTRTHCLPPTASPAWGPFGPRPALNVWDDI